MGKITIKAKSVLKGSDLDHEELERLLKLGLGDSFDSSTVSFKGGILNAINIDFKKGKRKTSKTEKIVLNVLSEYSPRETITVSELLSIAKKEDRINTIELIIQTLFGELEIKK